jgi:hypothetical protein
MDMLRNNLGRGLAAIGRAISNEDLAQEVEQEQADVNAQARAELERARIERDQLVIEEERRAINARRQQQEREHEEGAYYTVCERMIGKTLDKTWQAYLANIVAEYLDRNNVLEPKIRYEIQTRVRIRFLQSIPAEHRLTLNDVMNIQDRNRDLEGTYDEVVWFNPWTWHLKQNIQGNENGSWREQRLYSTSQVVTMGLVGIGGMAAGSYCIFKACQALGSYITIPRIAHQPMPPMRIDIPQLSSISTSLDKLADYISTSNNLDATPPSSLESNTSTELVIQLSGRCMRKLGSALNSAVESLVEFARSQK